MSNNFGKLRVIVILKGLPDHEKYNSKSWK
jgi:hypothetical protein